MNNRVRIQRKSLAATAELKKKHALGLTLSPLDLCYRKKLINEDLHRAANRFIALHNLRFCSSERKYRTSWGYVQDAYDKPHYTDEEIETKSKEYMTISKHLQSFGGYNLVLDLCVYDYYPGFLRAVGNMRKDFYDEYMLFKNALAEMNKVMMFYN